MPPRTRRVRRVPNVTPIYVREHDPRPVTPQLAQLVQADDGSAPPVPTGYRRAWFPAAVRLPDGTVHRLCRAYLATPGLYVFTGAPTDPAARTGPGAPAFFSTVDYDKTTPPPTSYPASQKMVRIHTAAGLVELQPLPGCGCSHRALKNWAPSWANRLEPWS